MSLGIKQITQQMKILFTSLIVMWSAYFTMAQGITIDNIDKTTSFSGDLLTISGNGFSNNPENLKVSFGAVAGDIISATPFLIEVTVPEGTTYDNIIVSNLATGLSAATNIDFLLAFGGENFETANLSPINEFNAGNGLYDLCLCDFNNDKKTDVASSNESSTQITVLKNTRSSIGQVQFARSSHIVNNNTQNIQCADLNNDGKPEIILSVSGSISNKVTYLKNTSTGENISFAPPKSLITDGNQTRRIEVADLDLDGKPEIIVSNQTNNKVNIFRNISTLSDIMFDQTSIVFTAGTSSNAGLKVKDLNNDKFPDIVITPFLSENVYILENQSSPGIINFMAATPLTVSGNIVNIAIGTLNNDQKPDIIVTKLTSSNISILENTTVDGATISFSSPQDFMSAERPWGVDLGDLNGDGKLDIAVSSINEASRFLNVFINKSVNNAFSFEMFNVGTNEKSRNIKVGDIDGNGKPDLIFTDIGNNKISVITNQHCLVPKIFGDDNRTLCVGSELRLQTSGAPNTTYVWSKNATEVKRSNEPFYIEMVNTPGNSTYSLVTEEGLCSSSSPNSVTVNVIDQSIAALTGIADLMPVCEGSNFILEAQSMESLPASATFVWTKPDNTTETTTTPILQVTNAGTSQAGQYQVEIRVGPCASNSVNTIVQIVSTSSTQITSCTAHIGDISVTTQAEVDALRTSLTPGTTRIVGNVTIGLELTTSDISDLSPLAAITQVTGNLIVHRNRGLPNLMGLNQLQSIGGDFEVGNNASLTSLGDFITLQSIGGRFEVGNNASLTSLGDFTTLQSVGGDFDMSGNDNLTSLGDFTILQTIGGDFKVSGNVDLTSLGDFPVLQSIRGGFEVSSNADLTSLKDFPALQSIEGSFEVYDNADLTSVRDFTALQSIGGSFEVSSNADLTSLGDFPVLQSIRGSFKMSGNDVLTSLGDFTALQSIGGDFEVYDNDVLTSLGAFSMLASIGSADGITVPSTGTDEDNVSILVEGNDLLQDCCVLIEFLSGATNAVSGQVFIGDNAPGCSSTTEVNCNFLKIDQKAAFVAKTATEGTLEIFSTLSWQLSKPSTEADWIINIAADGGNSDASSIAGENNASITITATANLNNEGRSTTLTLTATDMAGSALTDPAPVTILFTQLGSTHIGDITLTSQASVNAFPTSVRATQNKKSSLQERRLNAFSTNVTAIQGNLIIGNYDSDSDITDLRPLSGITHVTGRVEVVRNSRLVSLGSLTNLQAIGDNFRVEGNSLLQDCCVLTEFLSGSTNAVSGEVFINDNDSGCSTTTQLNCDPFLQAGKKIVFVAKTATESTLDIFSRQHWQLSKPDTKAEWITNIVADEDNSDASSITGENNAFITITTTANPNDAGRSTTLTLTAMDIDGNALADPAPITIPFTQWGTTHTGNVSVATQAEVEALRTSLTAGATRIVGNVTIGPESGASNISDLSPLAAITEIVGNVIVRQNPDLPNLIGLNQLQIIGGSFEMNRNDDLTSLGDFTALQSIGGSFVVGEPTSDDGNATLTSLGNFTALQTIGGSFVVERNTFLTSLGDFSTLHTIGDSFRMNANYALTSMGNFTALQSIGDGFEMRFSALTSLGDFTALQSIGGTFVVHINDDLTSLGNFPDLQTIGDDFEVTKNTNLTSLGDFTDLQSIGGSFEVGGNAVLPSLGDFSALQTIGSFEVGSLNGGNATLTSLGNFTALQSIEGDFEVAGNATLTSLGDFPVLQFIDNFVVGDNFSLTSLGNFPALQFMGDFFVEVNNGLKSLGDFRKLESIEGSFVMNYNDDLTSLGDFTKLQSIGGSFGVVGTVALTSLGDFPALQSIGGGLVMDFNAALTSLGEFPVLESIGSVDKVFVLSTGGNQDDVSILVENNDLLEECCVLTTFFSGATNAISGQVIIFNNATGCSSRAEINTCEGGSPSIRRVTTTGNALTDGSDWAKAMTLQAALAASTTVGDQVWIAEGTYKPGMTDDGNPATDERAATFTIPAGVLVYGGFVGTEADDFDPANTARTGAATILSGDLADNDVGRAEANYNALRNDNSYSVVTVTGPSATLDGVTVTAGESGTSGVGGGLYAVFNAATNMMVKDCLFTNNNADNSGGGAYFTESTILTGCTFTDNTAVENGGGAFFDAVLLGEASRLTDCTFTGNEAGKDGGGAYFGGVLFGEAATLTGCTFTDNMTGESGGGTYFSFGEIATLMGCTFKGNEAGKGGGMFIEEVEEAMLTDCIFTGNEAKYSYGGGAGFSETATLTNCVVAGNSAAGSGGGLVFSTGGTVINSTFYNNRTDTQGGGIAVFFNDTQIMVDIQTNPFTLQNSILIDNTATTAGDAMYLVYETPLIPSNIEATIDRNLLGSGMADLGVGMYDRATNTYTDDQLANAWNVTLSNTIKESDAAVVFASTNAVNADYLRVAAGSPAVNAGNNNYIPTGIMTDAAGNIRIQGGRIDLGAYESDTKLTQEITFIAPAADESGTVGQTIPIPLMAMTNAMGLFVTFSIDPATGVATLTDDGTGDGTGSLTLDGAGAVTVTASQEGNATYGAATPVTRTITVTKQSQVITFDDPTGGATVRVGQTIPLTATMDISELFVSFSIDPATEIATLTDDGTGDGTGSLTLDGAGTVMVTASQAGDATYAPAADVTHTITVEAVLGIEEGIDDFVLYPNPTSGKLHFSERVEQFRLYGIEGRLLETWKNVHSVDLSARHAGLYFAEVIRGGRSVRYRIMRE